MSYERKPVWESEIRDVMGGMIRNACGINHGQNYKKYVPLMELINYKINDGAISYSGTDKDTTKFKKFIETTDTLVKLVAAKWPFIDLEGIDLTWTSEQIIQQVVIMYGNVQVLKFDGQAPPMKDNTEACAKIEEIVTRLAGQVDKHKLSKTKYLGDAIKCLAVANKKIIDDKMVDEIIISIEKELAVNFPGQNFYVRSWASVNKLKKDYESNNKF